MTAGVKLAGRGQTMAHGKDHSIPLAAAVAAAGAGAIRSIVIVMRKNSMTLHRCRQLCRALTGEEKTNTMKVRGLPSTFASPEPPQSQERLSALNDLRPFDLFDRLGQQRLKSLTNQLPEDGGQSRLRAVPHS
jgi:hypothetical protein